VVQGQTRHHVVERTWIRGLLDPYAPEDGTFGRPRIDGRHGVAGASKGAVFWPLYSSECLEGKFSEIRWSWASSPLAHGSLIQPHI
jgi:hypothetical protein